jgi:hypothetical protein
MKNLIKHSSGSIRIVVRKPLKCENSEVIKSVGTTETISRMLRRYRNNIINPTLFRYSDLKLCWNLIVSHTEEEFFQYGREKYKNLFENDDLLIFFTYSAVRRLQEEETFCLDWTFSVVPRPFIQLIRYLF